jgi:ferredoxin
MQSDSFPTYTGERQNDSGGVDTLKEQVKIMKERLAALKEQIQDKEERDKDSRMIAHVIPVRCTGCSICQDICPTGAISFIVSVARINGANCTGCGRCVEACPQEAIVLRTA